MPDISSKFQKDPSITFQVIFLTHRQTNKQTNKNRQKHYLLGGGNYKQTPTSIHPGLRRGMFNCSYSPVPCGR